MAKDTGKITSQELIWEIYYVLSGAIIIFSLMEIIKPRLVIGYVNLNLIFVLWLLSGIILMINQKKYDSRRDN